METNIADNIRTFRKQRGLTQEQLAEILGVSIGAVYKWESKSCLPELRLIMEMADFFDVSVDTLLGYHMKDNRMNAAVERLWKASNGLDYDEVSEAEKATWKYPYSFDVVYAAAHLYYTFGSATKNKDWLRRAIELLNSARLLVSQCTDSRLNEAYICGEIAEMYEMLGETDKALKLLKENNSGAVFDDMIGIMMLSHGENLKEANDYLEDGFLRTITRLIQTVIGYAMMFDMKNDNASGISMMHWIIPTLEGLKKTDEPDFLSKMIMVFHVFLAVFQYKSGDRKGAEESLRKARTMAGDFDAAPCYTANKVKYVRESEMTNAHDLLGKTAMDAAEYVLKGKDPELRKLWEEGDLNGKVYRRK